jgi:hypothetical protein
MVRTDKVNQMKTGMRSAFLRPLAAWSRSQKQAAAVGLLVGSGLVYVYACYLQSSDVSPDSQHGYIFAIAGTLLLVLVGLGYTLRKRLRRARRGLLHAALAWHIVGGLLAFLLILMHAAGNFHPRTGTYALCSLTALVVSGIIGKQLDRIAPRLAARSALKTLTSDGEERLEALVGTLDRKRETLRALATRRKRTGEQAATGAGWEPWDLAYYTLDARAEEIPSLLHHARPASPYPPPTGTAALASESDEIRRAIGMELFYLRLIRVWRYLHIALSWLTLVLILWHLEYAATLLLGTK